MLRQPLLLPLLLRQASRSAISGALPPLLPPSAPALGMMSSVSSAHLSASWRSPNQLLRPRALLPESQPLPPRRLQVRPPRPQPLLPLLPHALHAQLLWALPTTLL